MADTNGTKAFSVSAVLALEPNESLAGSDTFLVGISKGRTIDWIGSPVTVDASMLPYSVSASVPAATGTVNAETNRPCLLVIPQCAVNGQGNVNQPAYSLSGAVTCEEKVKAGMRRGIGATSFVGRGDEIDAPGDAFSAVASDHPGVPSLVWVATVTALQD